MQTYTVAQLKTFIAAIPAAADTWTLVVPDSVPLMEVVTNLVVNGPNDYTCLVRRYLDLAGRQIITP